MIKANFYQRNYINCTGNLIITKLLASMSKPELLSRLCQMSTNSARLAPIETSIKSKLSKQLDTAHLEVINESYMHNVPTGAETHFKVVVVSAKFKDLPLIKRHRLVNDVLKDELNNGVHALSIVAKTPDQWENGSQKVDPSPNCRGGFGK